MGKELEDLMGELLTEMKAANARVEANDGRAGEGKAAQAAVAGELSKADDVRDAEAAAKTRKDLKADLAALMSEAVKAELHSLREPSKAALFGTPGAAAAVTSRMVANAGVEPHPALKASIRDYVSGEFLTGLMDVHGIGMGGIDLDRVGLGKAKLADLGVLWMGVPDLSKATLGTPAAAGGYVLPNNLVDTVIKPATQKAVWPLLVTTVNGVMVRGVDQPYRTGAPARMTVSNWGATKENVDEVYGSYSSVLCTIARVMDIAKQYARFSAGAAERDVMDELTRAAILAENYYIAAGAGGTGVPGTDTPTGFYPALLASAPTFTLAFSGPANTTLLGSAAKAFTQGNAALAIRSREAEAWVVDATTFWTILAQGTDTAGFFVAPTAGPTGFTRTASGGIAFWNTPIYYDANLGTNATTKIAIGGEFKASKLYRGMEFRVDTSDQAGERWDRNEIGFRGEEEIGFNPSSQIVVGAMQLITGVIA